MSDNCSENSVSRLDISGDIHTKYSRLAAEYSKIRAQNTVLKKAVVDEQARNNEVSQTLRDREQDLRKSSQEMESLNFRNLQLSRRVVVLQEELDNVQNAVKGLKKGKSKHNADIPNGNTNHNNILDEDLKKVIMENAKLLSSMQDKEVQYEKEIVMLKDGIQQLNNDLEACNFKLRKAQIENKDLIEELKRENEELRRENVFKLSNLKSLESEFCSLKKTYSSYVNEIAPKLKLQQQIIERHLPFVSDSDESLNKLNLRHSLLAESTNMVTLPSDIKQNLEAVVTSLSSIIQCIGIESNVPPKLPEIFSSIETLVERDSLQLFKEIQSCIEYMKNASSQYETDNEEQNIEKIVCYFLKSFLEVGLAFYASYLKKVKQLPEEINYTNELSLSSQVHLFQTAKNDFYNKCFEIHNDASSRDILNEHFKRLFHYIEKLVQQITEKDSKFTQSQLQNKCKYIDIFKKRASQYIFSLKKDDTERIPYSKAMKQQKEFHECLMVHNSLKDELNILKDALTCAEQEKVLWMNEYRLLEEKSKIVADSSLQSSMIESNYYSDKNKQEIRQTTNELGTLSSAALSQSEMLLREKMVKKYLTDRINAIIAEKQDAYSKARTFMFESKMLEKRLENSILDRQKIVEKLVDTGRTVLELQEELSTVTQNYELQLRMMTEHLANVNDKMTVQSDTIDQLNYQLHTKAKSTFYISGSKNK